jgi:hypothetical protein
MRFSCSCRLPVLVCCLVLAGLPLRGGEFSKWRPLPATGNAPLTSDGTVTLQSSGWSYLAAPERFANAEVSAVVTIDSPATQFSFFGASWSAWPDPTFGDQGFEAGLLLRATRRLPVATACSSRTSTSSWRLCDSRMAVMCVRYPARFSSTGPSMCECGVLAE